MGNFMPPAQTEDPLQTTDVEGLKGFDVTLVQDPGFATMQKNRYTDSIVDGNFGGWGQVSVKEDTLEEVTKGSRSKLGAVLYVSRYVTLCVEDTAQVCELWNFVDSITCNGEGRIIDIVLTGFLD